MKRWNNFISRYQLNEVNLGYFRVALGLGILFQLIAFLLPVIPLVYFNDGWINQAAYHELFFGLGYSIFDCPIGHFGVYVFFILTISLALLFTLGYKARSIGLVLLFCMFNIYQRGQLFAGAESKYCMAFLFLACLLPINAQVTFKGFKQKYRYNIGTYQWLSFLVIIQIGWIYFASGCLKTDPAWINGTALSMIFTTDPLNSYGFWLGKNLTGISKLSPLIILLEVSVGLLLFSGVKYIWSRKLLALSIVSLHVGIVLFLNLWQFVGYGIAAACLIYPFQQEGGGLEFSQNKSRFKIILIGLYLFLISIIQLQQLSYKSRISQFLRGAKIKKIVNVIQIPRLSMATPIHQNWALYSEIPKPFGCVEFHAKLADGRKINLITKEEITADCCSYNNLGQKEFLEITRILYFNSSEEIHQKIMGTIKQSLVDKWNDKNSQIKLVEHSVFECVY